MNTHWVCVALMVRKSLLFFSQESFIHLWLLFLQGLSLVSIKVTLTSVSSILVWRCSASNDFLTDSSLLLVLLEVSALRLQSQVLCFCRQYASSYCRFERRP